MHTSNTLIAIRLIYTADPHATWEDRPIVAYMPMFLSGPSAIDNIKQRIQLTYFRHDPDLLRVYCHPKDNIQDGFWVERAS